MRSLVIFTDLDGTLLDHQYMFDAALPALQRIKENDIPLVICSSKTRTEIEYYRRRLLNHHPFISENGGGIFIPRGYLQLADHIDRTTVEEADGYFVIRLGALYKELRRAIRYLQKKGFDVKGFGDMTLDEISQVTGLSAEETAMAKEREFDEPFLFDRTEEKLGPLFASIRELGFSSTQGKYFHLLGNSDKGKAVSILIDIFRKHSGDVLSIALGDSPNDLPMLQNVDMPIIVRKQDGTYDPSINLSDLVRADGIGPKGWNKAILELLKQM